MDFDKSVSPETVGNTKAEAPRENLISTAVKFLQNPQVRQSPFTQRKSFLVKKGLTDEEIDIAVERSGVGKEVMPSTTPTAPAQSTAPSAAQSQLVVQHHPTPSTWQKARDVASTAIVIGGVSYAVYVIYKRYIAPAWFGPSKQEQQMDALQRSLTDLQQTMTQTLTNIQETQALLSRQQDSIQDLAKSYAAARGPNEFSHMQGQALGELKEEMKSVKALLLSSRRFAAAPTTTPVIPAWQMKTSASQPTLNGDADASAMRGKHADRSGVPDSVEADEDLVQASSATVPSSGTGKPPEAAFTVKPPEAEQSEQTEASHTTHSSQSDDVNASVSDEQKSVVKAADTETLTNGQTLTDSVQTTPVIADTAS